MIPNRVLIFALECLLQTLPGAGAGKEGLRNVEAQAVVIGIEEPRWHVLGATMVDFHLNWIENIEAQQLDFVLLSAICLLRLANLGFGKTTDAEYLA
jgi:hypothetical protein